METGRLFSVDGSGLSREWIDIEVKKAVDGVSWDLSVNGEEAALGVGGVKYDGEPVPSLYFIGDERADTFFDELAVSEAETEGVAAPVFGGSLNSVIAVGPGVGSGADRGGGSGLQVVWRIRVGARSKPGHDSGLERAIGLPGQSREGRSLGYALPFKIASRRPRESPFCRQPNG